MKTQIEITLSQDAEDALKPATDNGIARSVAVTKAVDGIFNALVGESRLSTIASFYNADVNAGRIKDSEFVLSDGGNVELSSDVHKAVVILASDKDMSVSDYVNYLIVSANNSESLEQLKTELADV